MTSENNLNEIKEVLTDEQEKLTIDETKEESTDDVTTKTEEEQTHKPDSEPQKLDESSESESETKDNELDTQPLFEQPTILEGKRSRKPTLRLELSELAPPKKELSIPQGHGKPLGEIEFINYQITHASTDALTRMRNICFGRRGVKANIRKNLREFKGFEFERNSDEYQKHLNSLTKLKKDQLRSISDILGLPSTGRNTDHAERILTFLTVPIDEGKRVPERKISKKRSTNSKESLDTDEETKKEKIENGNNDCVDKPVKKSSVKRSSNDKTVTNTKRKRGTSTASKSKVSINEEKKENEETPTAVVDHKSNGEEIVTVNENNMDDNPRNTDSKLIEKADQNEAIMHSIVQDVI